MKDQPDMNFIFHGIIEKLREDNAFRSMGRSSFLIFKGAIEAGATEQEALKMSTAFMAGILANAQIEEEEDNDQ